MVNMLVCKLFKTLKKNMDVKTDRYERPYGYLKRYQREKTIYINNV
jgi:hypothetical protein